MRQLSEEMRLLSEQVRQLSGEEEANSQQLQQLIKADGEQTRLLDGFGTGLQRISNRLDDMAAVVGELWVINNQNMSDLWQEGYVGEICSIMSLQSPLCFL